MKINFNMMVKRLQIIVILLISLSSFGQNKGLVYYDYIDAIGIGNAKGPVSNSYLVFDNSKSYYVTAKDSLEKAENLDKEITFMNDDDSGGSIHNGMKSSRLGDQVFCDNKTKTLYCSLMLKKQIYTKETLSKIDWKILKDTKTIGKFKCKKATAYFRGRNYIAWFAPEIANSFGPWKLNGLPGLILEAYDTNKNVNWSFKSIEYPSKTKEKVGNVRTIKGSKFKYLNLSEFSKFCNDQIQESYEKMIIVSKQHPGVIPIKGSQKDFYIEIFEND